MEITSEFIFQVLGAKEVELAMLRLKVMQLEAQLRQLAPPPTPPQAPPPPQVPEAT